MKNKVRKKIAEWLFELGMIILPKFKDEDYLGDMIYGLNLKYS